MIANITYDVFIKGEGGDRNDDGLRGVSRFGRDLDAFTKRGLEFRYFYHLRTTAYVYVCVYFCCCP